MLSNIEIVLVHPVYAGNVGALARSAMNFGVNTIKIVGDLQFLCLDAKKMALYGYPLLEQADRFETLEEALAPCSLVIGTVHQSRFNRTAPRPSWKLMDHLAPRLATERTAVVFGREDNGLTREEINLCHFLATIPTPENTSFNLAHSVTVFLYEIYRTIHGGEFQAEARRPSQGEWENALELAETTLRAMGFFKGTQVESVMIMLREIAFRSQIHAAELPLLKAVLYKMLNIARTHLPQPLPESGDNSGQE